MRGWVGVFNNIPFFLCFQVERFWLASLTYMSLIIWLRLSNLIYRTIKKFKRMNFRINYPESIANDWFIWYYYTLRCVYDIDCCLNIIVLFLDNKLSLSETNSLNVNIRLSLGTESHNWSKEMFIKND